MSDLISPHLKALRARGLSPNTVIDREGFLRRLARALHPTALDNASTEELQEWLGNPGWTTKTRETYWCHLVGFYRWAVRGRAPRLDWDPTEDIDRPTPRRRPPRVASDDQLRHVLAALDRPALRAVILAAGAGMRACEIARAERCHFTRERVTILGKGDRVRRVPLTDEVWDEICEDPGGPIITSRGMPVTAKWVTKMVARALDRAGFPTLTAHWFRGAYATRLRRSGVDTMAICRLLGHSSVATTEQYLEVDDDDLVAAVAKLPLLRTGAPGRAPAGVYPAGARSENDDTR